MAQIDIAKLRKRLGDGDKPLSQAELAKRIGVNQATVSKWESGRSRIGRLGARLIEDFAEKCGAAS